MPDAVPCNHCGTPFTPYMERGTVQRFCSDRCRYAGRVDTRFIPTGTTLTATCVECGQDFTYESATKPQTICSNRCARTRKAARARVRRARQTSERQPSQSW